MSKATVTIRILLGLNTVHNIWLGISILIGIGLIILDLFVKQGIYSAFAFPILYNAMDLIGYRNIVKDGAESMTSTQAGTGLYILQAYRILQHSWEFLLAVVVGLLAGWEWMGLGLLLKFTSSADILYHALGKYPMFPQHWHYQGWTIVGWFWMKRDLYSRKEIPSFIIYTQFLTGIAVVVAYYICKVQ